MMLQSDGWACW